MSEKNKINHWDEARKSGILIFIFSLPVLIWKSLKVGGKLTIIFLIFVSLWGISKASDVYFSKIYNRARYANATNGIEKWITETQKDIDSVNGDISDIRNSVKTEIQKEVERNVRKIEFRFEEVNEKIDEIEKSVEAIRSEERRSVKERIAELNELVSIQKRSIDEKEIRIEFEEIVDSSPILEDHEKERLFKVLEDIGFYIVEKRNEVQMIHNTGYSYSSADIAFVGYARERKYGKTIYL